ncbi:MAG TPA: GNAT family N-acetyltransferase [Verrucomicrobiae bacterium]|nr:GNAT family N-acetyltransferase [Verrucomicrobiae bacterium]
MNEVSPLAIREAILADEAQLLPMMRKLAEQQPGAIKFDEPAVRVTFGRFLSVPAFGKVWLLCEGTKPVGYVVLTLGFSFEFHGHDAFIDELYIEAAFGRRGYGRQAVAFVERKAREMGVNAIHLEVGRGNDPACELYRRAGYQDHDRFLMTKWLNGEAQ